MNDIFISYAREDLGRARQLAQALEAQGWSVFWDQAIPPGKSWHEAIGTGLQDARCVIVAWSEVSIKKDWVREEAEEGKARKILVPVLFDKVRPPIGFRSIQAASLLDWDGSPTAGAFRQLVSAITGIISLPEQSTEWRPSPAEVEPPPTQKPELPALQELLKKSKQDGGPSQWIAGLAVGTVIAGLVALALIRNTESPVSKKEQESALIMIQGASDKASLACRELKEIALKRKNLEIARGVGETALADAYEKQIQDMEQNIRDGTLVYKEIVSKLGDLKKAVVDAEFDHYHSVLLDRKSFEQMNITLVVQQHYRQYLSKGRLDNVELTNEACVAK